MRTANPISLRWEFYGARILSLCDPFAPARPAATCCPAAMAWRISPTMFWLSSSARFMTRSCQVSLRLQCRESFSRMPAPGSNWRWSPSGGSDERAEFRCRVLHRGRQRDFLGFCRARNAVIEAAIMATRLAFHERNRAAEILNQYMKVVEKTGSEMEKQAFQLVCEYVEKQGE